jgi:hypothetical protein
MYHSSDYISIHEVNKQLTFKNGLYHLDVIGGWEVQRNGFAMKLVHENGEDEVFPISTWPVHNWYSWKKGKRIFDFQVSRNGIYTLHFSLPEDLVVRPMGSSWFSILRLFDRKVNNKLITVIFYRK